MPHRKILILIQVTASASYLRSPLEGQLFAKIHCVSKYDTDLAYYNFFNAHHLILVICGTDVGETVCYRTMISCPTSPN